MKRKSTALSRARAKIKALKADVRAQTLLRLTAESKLLYWRDISSAPRGGTAVLVKGAEGNPSVASFHTAPDGQAGWVGGIANGQALVLQRVLTHWCKLP